MWLGSKADRDYYNASLNILKIKTGAGRPVAPVERILKYSEPFLTVNKGSDFGASFLNEARTLSQKQVVIYPNPYD